MKSFKLLVLFTLGILLILIGALLLVRALSEVQLDDVTPGIPCDLDLMQKADAYYVIPKFEGNDISKNHSWCEEILALNKSLRLHGFYHEYNEFATDRDEEYLKEAQKIFQECFNQTPTRFKAPQLNISKENTFLVKKYLRLDGKINQILHKVYHCKDSGVPYNKFNDWF